VRRERKQPFLESFTNRLGRFDWNGDNFYPNYKFTPNEETRRRLEGKYVLIRTYSDGSKQFYYPRRNGTLPDLYPSVASAERRKAGTLLSDAEIFPALEAFSRFTLPVRSG